MIQLPPIPLRSRRIPKSRGEMSPEVDNIIGMPACPVFCLSMDDGHLEDEFAGTTYSSSTVEPAPPITETEARGSSTSAASGVLSGYQSEVGVHKSPVAVGANIRALGKRASNEDVIKENPAVARCKRKHRSKDTKRVSMADPTTTRPRKRRNMLRTLDGPDSPSGEVLATVLKQKTSAQNVGDHQKELDRLRTKRDVLMQELARVKATAATLQEESLRTDDDANAARYDANEAQLYYEMSSAASRNAMIDCMTRATEEAEEKAKVAASAAHLSNMDVRRVYRMATDAELAWKRASMDTSDHGGKDRRARGRALQSKGIASQELESTAEKGIVVPVWDSEEEKPAGMESRESGESEYSGGVNSNEEPDVSVPTASIMVVGGEDCPDQSHDDDDGDESTDEGQGVYLSRPLQLFRSARTDGETKPASISWRALGFDLL